MYRISRFENFEVNMKHVVENSISGNLCLNLLPKFARERHHCEDNVLLYSLQIVTFS